MSFLTHQVKRPLPPGAGASESQRKSNSRWKGRPRSLGRSCPSVVPTDGVGPVLFPVTVDSASTHTDESARRHWASHGTSRCSGRDPEDARREAGFPSLHGAARPRGQGRRAVTHPAKTPDITKFPLQAPPLSSRPRWVDREHSQVPTS